MVVLQHMPVTNPLSRGSMIQNSITSPRRVCYRPFSGECHRTRQQHKCASTRRDSLTAILLTPLVYPVISVTSARAEDAVASKTQQYMDNEDSFSLTLPSSWVSAEGQIEGNKSFQGSSGARRTLAWFPADIPADQVNVTLTITNTSLEFTGLGSFGNVFAFGTNLVNSMDRSFLLRIRGRAPDEPIQVAKLVDAKESRGMYCVEYTVEKQPGPRRHLYSQVALHFNGRYNRLYTLTAQCLEDQVQEVEPVLKQILGSFQPPAVAV